MLELPDAPVVFQAAAREGHLSLSAVETELQYPSVAVDTEVAVNGFSVVASSVWLDLPAVSQFVLALTDLEANRHGTAVLQSMSPGVLRLDLALSQRPRSFTATVTISASCYSPGGERVEQHARIAFPVDEGFLRGWLSWFRQLEAHLSAGAA